MVVARSTRCWSTLRRVVTLRCCSWLSHLAGSPFATVIFGWFLAWMGCHGDTYHEPALFGRPFRPGVNVASAARVQLETVGTMVVFEGPMRTSEFSLAITL